MRYLMSISDEMLAPGDRRVRKSTRTAFRFEWSNYGFCCRESFVGCALAWHSAAQEPPTSFRLLGQQDEKRPELG